MKKKSILIVSMVIVAITALAVSAYVIDMHQTSDNSNNLYSRTSEFLEQEFHRVYDKYYDIQGLTISNWQENGNEATFFYKMTYLHYNREPDTVDYIKQAKERGQKEYETLYNDYLAEKEVNYQFKIVLNGNELELYSDVSVKGEAVWLPTKIDDYIMSN